MATFLAATLGAACQDTSCEIPSAALANIPVDLKILDCTRNESSQPHIAVRYQVATKDVPELEAFLVREYGMAPLKFMCCYWGPMLIPGGAGPSARFKHDGFSYEVVLYSVETRISDPRERDQIPYFLLSVTKYLTEI